MQRKPAYFAIPFMSNMSTLPSHHRYGKDKRMRLDCDGLPWAARDLRNRAETPKVMTHSTIPVLVYRKAASKLLSDEARRLIHGRDSSLLDRSFRPSVSASLAELRCWSAWCLKGSRRHGRLNVRSRRWIDRDHRCRSRMSSTRPKASASKSRSTRIRRPFPSSMTSKPVPSLQSGGQIMSAFTLGRALGRSDVTPAARSSAMIGARSAARASARAVRDLTEL